MAVNKQAYEAIKKELDEKQVTLVAVSKTKPVEAILELYELGHRDFGENYVQELVDKQERLPQDIRWHFIGHLQSNKVKYIAPFVHLIHGVDSEKLLAEIAKQALKNNRIIDCLLQVHIATEETKFGLDETELKTIINHLQEDMQPAIIKNVHVKGLMGMASFTTDREKVRMEFRNLKRLYDSSNLFTIHHSPFTVLSMGMSSDYKIAIEEGSNMVRIGSLLFGERNPSTTNR